MQLHDLQPKTSRRRGQRIGRGGKRGTTSGRGTKGQKARAGAKIRPALRDIIKKLPKLRGRGKHSFRSFQRKPEVINLADLERVFSSGDTIDMQVLIKKGLVRTMGGRNIRVKILGGGILSKKFLLKGLSMSASARAAITGAGGTVA